MERRGKERESERVRLCCILRWVLWKRVHVEAHTVSNLCLELF